MLCRPENQVLDILGLSSQINYAVGDLMGITTN